MQRTGNSYVKALDASNRATQGQVLLAFRMPGDSAVKEVMVQAQSPQGDEVANIIKTADWHEFRGLYLPQSSGSIVTGWPIK